MRAERARATRAGVAAWLGALLLVAATGAAAAAAADAPLEQKVDDLFARLTEREKVLLMSGGSIFATHGIERLGIPSVNFSDGPNGVRSNEGLPATVFPTGSALAATWNPTILEHVGAAIGREAHALDIGVMLGPNVNIQRSPLAGRNFEAYSEDPYLAGRLGIGFVNGVQSQGVGTSVKHFVANEQEADRMRGSSNVDERTLHEIYLVPFEMVVKEAHPWTVMESYNRLNGTYMSENGPLLRGVLKGEWSYDGVLMSDWGAVHTTVAAANGGMDLEMPGPPRYFGNNLLQAVHNWQVEQSVVDEAAKRMLRLILRCNVGGKTRLAEVGSERNHAVALEAAREAVVLLKNERGLLPLDKTKLHSLAVLGPNADAPLYEGGGSAGVIPGRTDTPLSALRKALPGVNVTYVAGADNDALPPPLDPRWVSVDAARKQRGLSYSFYTNATFSGAAQSSGVDVFFDKTLLPAPAAQMSMRWEGFLTPAAGGRYEISLSQLGEGTLYLDDREVVGPNAGTLHPALLDFGAATRVAAVDLEAGRSYRLRVDYVTAPISFHSLHIGLRRPPSSIEAAVQAARAADAAVVFVGSSRSSETEGRDRPDMELIGKQNELVAAVLAANPNTIVVLNSGAPVALPWAEHAPALLQAWLAGEAEPEAVTDVLLGAVNPSGKLPFTLPRRLADNPAYLYYSPGRDANYGEGVFVGYRYYDKRDIEPLFPFGHGLSYTSFEYGKLHVPAGAGPGKAPLEVTVDVKNSGRRAGQEVVQLYVGDETTTDVVRPRKELRAFSKVSLAAGESRTLRFLLSERDLSYYDAQRRGWRANPGKYRIYVGASSRDIRQSEEFQWVVPLDPRAPAPQATPSALDMF